MNSELELYPLNFRLLVPVGESSLGHPLTAHLGGSESNSRSLDTASTRAGVTLNPRYCLAR